MFYYDDTKIINSKMYQSILLNIASLSWEIS